MGTTIGGGRCPQGNTNMRRVRRETRKPALLVLGVQFLLLLVLVMMLGGRAEDIQEAPTQASLPEGKVDEDNVFIATNEWQRVPDGASIPGGLWVRMDLSSGGRYARLLDKEGEAAQEANKVQVFNVTESAVAKGGDADPVDVLPPSSPTTPSSPRQTMENVLMNLPEEEIKMMGVDLHKKKKELPEEEYWSLVESLWNERQQLMTRVYAQMMKPAEVLTKLIDTLKQGSLASEDDMNHALINLEDHLADIDMSRDFHTLGGWPHLVALLESHYPISIRTNAAWVIGNAVKNDQDFQRWMLEDMTGTIPPGVAAAPDSALARLLFLLSKTSLTPRVDMSQLTSTEATAAAQSSAKVDGMLRKAVYALTSATRGNLELQKHLVEAGALHTLSGLVSSEDASRPLRVKVASFLYDLLVEAQYHGPDKGQEVFHALQLDTANWCPGLESLMGRVQADPVELEQVLLATSVVLPHCTSHSFVKALQAAAKVYTSGEGGTGVAINSIYRDEIRESISSLLAQALALEGRASVKDMIREDL